MTNVTIEIFKDIGVGLVVLASVATIFALMGLLCYLVFYVPYGWTLVALLLVWCLGYCYREIN